MTLALFRGDTTPQLWDMALMHKCAGQPELRNTLGLSQAFRPWFSELHGISQGLRARLSISEMTLPRKGQGLPPDSIAWVGWRGREWRGTAASRDILDSQERAVRSLTALAPHLGQSHLLCWWRIWNQNPSTPGPNSQARFPLTEPILRIPFSAFIYFGYYQSC